MLYAEFAHLPCWSLVSGIEERFWHFIKILTSQGVYKKLDKYVEKGGTK